MKIFKSILLGSMVLLPVVSTAQTTQKFTAAKSNDFGVVYTLPVTALDITLSARMTKLNPGEFNNYARLHLGIDNAVKQSEYAAEISAAVITVKGIADPESRWQTKLKSGNLPFIMLNQDNCLLSVNTEGVYEPVLPELPKPVAAPPTPLETEEAKQAVTLEMTRSSSKSKKAELAAQRIFELREMRSDLMSGQAENTPPDGKSLELALANISAQEEALTAMFAGTKSTSTIVSTLTFIPDSTDVTNRVIARLSPVDGFVDPDDMTGEPIYLNVKVTERGQMPVNEKGEKKPFPKGGLAYNIPGTARVTITFRNKIILSQDIKLSQLGITYGLDPEIFTDKKSPASAIFDPTTGALIEVGVKTR